MTETVNGNGDHVNDAVASAPPPITEIFANFVHDAQYEDLAGDQVHAVKDMILDFIGVACAAVEKAESTDPVYRAVTELAAPPPGYGGSQMIFTKGRKYSIETAALMNAFLGHSLDFDDTFTDGSVHAGVTAITAALVVADSLSLSKTPVEIMGKPFLTAVAVGYEITCRLSREIGQAAYARGFHNTSTTGIFGAVGAIASLKNLKPAVIDTAFGLAGSRAAGSMQYLENGSWNKRLHPGFAVRDALLCVALAEKGVVGATQAFEGRFGFFHMYSTAGTGRQTDWARLLHGLRSEWIFLGSLIKPYPACRMTHGLIEMVDRMRTKTLFESGSSFPDPSIPSQTIKRIKISIPPYQASVVGAPVENKIHPRNIVDAQFSAYYQVALTWLHGSRTGWAGYDHLNDAELHSLTNRITIDPTEKLLRFQQHIVLEFADGSSLEDTIRPPAEPEEMVKTTEYRQKVIDKFFSLATPVYGAKRAQKIKEVIQDLENRHLLDLLSEVQ